MFDSNLTLLSASLAIRLSAIPLCAEYAIAQHPSVQSLAVL